MVNHIIKKRWMLIILVICIILIGFVLSVSSNKNNSNVFRADAAESNKEEQFEDIEKFAAYTKQGGRALLKRKSENVDGDFQNAKIIKFDGNQYLCNEKKFKYLLKVEGTLPNASFETCFWCLCNEKINFNQIKEDLLSADSSKHINYLLI